MKVGKLLFMKVVKDTGRDQERLAPRKDIAVKEPTSYFCEKIIELFGSLGWNCSEFNVLVWELVRCEF